MALIFSKQDDPLYDPRVAFIQAVLGMPAAEIDGKFGPKTETELKSFQRSKGITNDGKVDERTGRALDLPYWDAQQMRMLDVPFRDPNKFPATHQFVFRSSQDGGHFSHRPDRFVSGDPRTKRAIRTNNPGALNISQWQKALPGYVGRTQSDSSAAANKTTIYLSAEDGVHAWYLLIVVRYEQIFHLISHGTGSTINVRRLAKAYGIGDPDKPDGALSGDQRDVVNAYLGGWKKWSTRPAGAVVLEPGTELDPQNSGHMLSLARAMFSHEASLATPLLDAQIQYGIDRARAPGPLGEAAAPSPAGEDLARARQEEIESSLERFQSVLGKLRGTDRNRTDE